MAEDLADQIDDYICVFEGAGDLTMDTFVMLLFALIVVVISIVFASKLLYDKYVKKSAGTADVTGASTAVSSTVGGAVTSPALAGSVLPKDGTRVSEPKELLTSKKDAILAQVRNGSMGGGARAGGFGGSGGIGGVGFGGKASGPTIARKRISRKSPEITPKKRPVVPPSNINGTDGQIVQWSIHLFRWLYSDLVVVNKLLQDWVATVNTALLSYVEQHEMIVEVVRVLPESPPPSMSSILCEAAEQPNEVEMLFDVESTPVLQIKAFKSNNQKTEISHYKATISRLKSRVSVILNYFALKGEMKLEGYPDIKIQLNSIGPLKTANAQDEKKQSDLITDLLISSIRDVVYPVDFSIYSTCPRLMGDEPEEASLDYGYGPFNDGYRSYQDDGYNNALSMPTRKLLVKVLKAERLLPCTQPFCVVEMDEPAQKHQSVGKTGANPVWDETFLFDLSNHSTELLFEVYDSVAVGNNDDDDDDDVGDEPDGQMATDNAVTKPEQHDDSAPSVSLHVPPKDTNSQQDNGNDGTATAAVCPTNDEPLEPAASKSSSPSNACTTTSTTNPNQRSVPGGQRFLGLGLVGIDELAHGPATTQILELQPRPYETENITGTLTVEFVFIDSPPVPSPRKQFTQQSFHANGETAFARDGVGKLPHSASAVGSPNLQSATGTMNGAASAPTSPLRMKSASILAERNQRFQTAEANRMNNSFLKPLPMVSPTLNGKQSESTPVSPALSSLSPSITSPLSNSAPVSVNKTDKKPRNIFGTLRNKLTLSKKSKSLDASQYSPTDGGNVRSASSTLSRGSSLDQRSNIFPNIKNLSRKSSISESSAISGLSTGSGRTYVHEESTLLLETIENNVVRHYLVPLIVATKQKNWKRKGTKLHVYNDHTFVAKHIKGGVLCFVCNRSIVRRPGKQGYECRDCMMQCHKPCHVRAPQACPNPKILSVQLLKWPSQ